MLKRLFHLGQPALCLALTLAAASALCSNLVSCTAVTSTESGGGAIPNTPALARSVPGPSVKEARFVPAPLVNGHWKQFVLTKQSLRMPLPEGPLWSTGDEGTFWKASHSETRSTLLVKRWREGRLVNDKDCEAQASLWKPSFERPQSPAAYTELLSVPQGYRTLVSVYVVGAPNARHELSATMYAFGANLRECLALMYRTETADSAMGRTLLRQRVDVMTNAVKKLQLYTSADSVRAISNE